MQHACLFALLLVVTSMAAAQARAPKVAFLHSGPAGCNDARVEAFHQGLRVLGYVHGRTIDVETRCYGTASEMRRVLAESIERKADVIVVGVPAAAIAARGATRDTPIVCASCGDPLDYGLVTSLSRPGGNVTGLASLSAELIGKRLELLREIAPGITRVAALLNPDNPGTGANIRALEHAAIGLKFDIARFEFRKAADFESAFQSAADSGAAAVLIQDDPFTFAGRAQIGRLALKQRLPVIAGVIEVAEAGALVAYGPNRVDLHRRAAGFVDKILKGAKPAELPIEQPSKFDLVLNLRTAAALGLTLPPSLVLRADRTID